MERADNWGEITVTDYSTLTDDELSDQVAVRVMGWRAQMGANGGVLFWRDAASGATAYPFVFDPATEYSAAGMVLERMRTLGWMWMAEYTDAARAGYVLIGVGVHARATARTPQRAICEAALKAMDAREPLPEPPGE